MDILSKADPGHKVETLTLQLSGKWDNASKSEHDECISIAKEASCLLCHVIAPDEGKKLYQTLQMPQDQTTEEKLSGDLLAIITAYRNAPTRNLKTQILSFYAYRTACATPTTNPDHPDNWTPENILILNLSDFKLEHFHSSNILPDQPCSAYFYIHDFISTTDILKNLKETVPVHTRSLSSTKT